MTINKIRYAGAVKLNDKRHPQGEDYLWMPEEGRGFALIENNHMEPFFVISVPRFRERPGSLVDPVRKQVSGQSAREFMDILYNLANNVFETEHYVEYAKRKDAVPRNTLVSALVIEALRFIDDKEGIIFGWRRPLRDSQAVLEAEIDLDGLFDGTSKVTVNGEELTDEQMMSAPVYGYSQSLGEHSAATNRLRIIMEPNYPESR